MGRAKNCPTLSSSSSSSTAAASKTNNNNNNNNSSSSSSSNNNTDNNTDNNQTTTKKEKPFVSTAVVGLVTTGDHLLLTRRPSYMRSFPGAFVFPGGGVHDGETLSQAATREVYEETNVTVPVDNWNLECVWESVYPTSTSIGPISAHHIVCYLSGRALPDDDDDEDHDDTTTKELNQPANDGRHVRLPTVKLCDDEVDGAIWLSRDDMEWIIQSSSGKDVDAFYQEKRTVDLITTKRLLSTMTIDHIPLCDASGIYPRLNDEGSVCGMAQGSLFALEHFCSKT
jgi:8-oxo-dGTP pyrophosphatase MutT (NUDIX family)